MRMLKKRARRGKRSMEMEAQDVMQARVVEKRAVLEQIAASWAKLKRRPTAAEIESWMEAGR